MRGCCSLAAHLGQPCVSLTYGHVLITRLSIVHHGCQACTTGPAHKAIAFSRGAALSRRIAYVRSRIHGRMPYAPTHPSGLEADKEMNLPGRGPVPVRCGAVTPRVAARINVVLESSAHCRAAVLLPPAVDAV